MSEATIKNLTTPLPNEEPFLGDGEGGEIVTNTSDGRAWVFDQTGFPVELGGACVNKPVNSNLFSGNYLEIDITNPDNLPIPNTDPLQVRPGTCREIRILIRYVGDPLTTFSTYFDYEVDWGAGISDPLVEYAETGSEILVELSTFGPRPAWMGRVLWVKNAEISSGTIIADLNGNASTASALQTARNINGVPFNGTQNINIDAPPSHSVYKTVYVSPEGSNTSTGRNENRPVSSIERALEIIESQGDSAGWTVKILGDVNTAGNIPVPDFTTILSSNMQRRSIIRPLNGGEENNVFLCGNGVHLYGLKFTGWQIDDFNNPTKGFAMAFRPGAIILPGGVPYGQNCVVSSVTTDVPTPLPMDAPGGNPAHPRGGGCVLADASVLSAYTVYPNMMTWGFTPSTANGLGYVARNRGFVNPVNAIGIGAHRHFMCLDGGQMVVSGSSSQFGDYSFWSEGSIQRVVPLKVNPAVLATQGAAATIINGVRVALINDAWSFLVANHSANTWPAGFETLTRKDSGLFLDALAACLVHGFERPMLNFAEGMFRFDGTCVYTYSFHAAFKACWDRLVAQLIAGGQLTSGAVAFVNALVARLKATMDNYWFEVGSGPAPTPVEKVRRKLRSEITAINHQWTAPLAGVEYFRVPPARAARRIQRSIVQRNGGRVKFSGQDDAGNAVFVGGLVIDARSGQLSGPPFDSAIRGRVTRAVISRSY